MEITVEQLSQILTRCRQPQQWADLLNDYLPGYGIETPDQIARFLAQCGHESADFNVVEENLNYSADRLKVIFPKYFRNANPQTYHRNPECIANLVYANRMGNGDERSGDGWKYRGRGVLQVTGKFNYTECSEYIFGNDTLVKDPDLLFLPEYALRSALWYWHTRKLNAITDMTLLTKRINGGTIGLAHRLELYEKAIGVLA